MTRETYLRVVLHSEGVQVIASLEMKPSDTLGELRAKMKVRMTNATTGLLPGRWDDMAEAIDKALEKHWPDRSRRIDVGDARNGWVRINVRRGG